MPESSVQTSILRWAPLYTISALSLFLEIAVIRWLSAEVRLFSYFKLLPLLAAFMGLSIGFAIADQARDYLRSFVPLMALFTLLTIGVGSFLSPRLLTYPAADEEFLWFTGDYAYGIALATFLAVVLIFFLATMLLFIPLGQATGREMARHEPVPAYIVNLVASLTGIWIFVYLSYLRTPPFVWLAAAILGMIGYLAYRNSLSRSQLVILGGVLVLTAMTGRNVIWSPYHRLDITELFLPSEEDQTEIFVGYTLKVQQAFYQVALDLSNEFLSMVRDQLPDLESMETTYNLPYKTIEPGAAVLALGTGMGNDVAAALRNGVENVVAVEIDPSIVRIGSELHPESPYDDPRVTLLVDDARAVLEKDEGAYDAITFGFLDSQTLLSGMSSVRLDSYVYTLESLELVKALLVPEGFLSLAFGADVPWIEERLGRMLSEVFGPEQVYIHRGLAGSIFIVGTLSQPEWQDLGLIPWEPSAEFDDLPLPTDDWPYLYLRAQRIPSAYWQALLVISIACLALIARTFPQALRPDLHFWLLGAGFLLVEFKIISEMALLFGTTWLVNALAISGVLTMALSASVIVLFRGRLNVRFAYVLLFFSLGFGLIFPLEVLLRLSPGVRALSSMFLLSMPLFFSGLIFGESLRRAQSTSIPLASNLSGSVAGGLLVYGSMLWGIRSLYVIAAFVYAGAFLTYLIRRR